jgi:isopenicillin N synthase-like dioxygenase
VTNSHAGRVRLPLSLLDRAARFTDHTLTDDVFRSTMHRAFNRSGVTRYSIPLFFGTDYNVSLEASLVVPWVLSLFADVAATQALPSCVSDDFPAKYEVVTAGEYVKSRLEATYSHSV